MGYLDNSGLSYLWGKIKTALGGKQDKESSVSVPGSGALSMSESLGSGPYTIEFTEEAGPKDVSASEITYDNTESGMTAANVQDAITELSAAPKGGPGVPAGSVFWLATQTAPEGYLICDGSAVSRTEYVDLFATIGTTFGSGDGSTTFALPNLQAAFIRGAGSQKEYSATFGEQQDASLLTTVTAKPSGTNYNSSVPTLLNGEGVVRNVNMVAPQASSAALTYNQPFIRPFNIALTPIIKY